MKKLSLVLLFVFVLAASVPVLATPIIKMDRSHVPYLITVMDLDGQSSLGIYTQGQSFESFCMEKNEFFHPGNTYAATISTVAKYNDYNTDYGYDPVAGGDPLDARTAFLYTQFINNSFAASYLTSGWEQQLQDAIHYIEQDRNDQANNPFVILANAAVAPGGVWYGKGIGDVRVLNVWNKDAVGASHVQDQLITVPEPATILLQIMGLGIFSWLPRRRTVKKTV